MTLTFSLTGSGNHLSSSFYPPIELDPRGEYGLGLIGFYSYNALQNIHAGNNKIYWSAGGPRKSLVIPDGAYEITALHKYVDKTILQEEGESKKKKKNLKETPPGDEQAFSLVANTNTLQCVVKSKYAIDFAPADSIGRMLGFSPRLLEPNVTHLSDLDVRISPATNIRVQCSVTGGAFLNGVPDHTIFEFALDSEPGEMVAKEPPNVLYLKVVPKRLSDIVLWLTDQNGKPVNFGKEQVSVRLALKKWD